MSAAEAPAPAPAAAVKAKTVDEEKNVNALWRESIDKKTGRTYYVNKLTKKVQWKRPDGYTIDSEALWEPTNWKVGFDTKKQKEYYYNKAVKVTRWKKPGCLDTEVLKQVRAKKLAKKRLEAKKATQVVVPTAEEEDDDDFAAIVKSKKKRGSLLSGKHDLSEGGQLPPAPDGLEGQEDGDIVMDLGMETKLEKKQPRGDSVRVQGKTDEVLFGKVDTTLLNRSDHRVVRRLKKEIERLKQEGLEAKHARGDDAEPDMVDDEDSGGSSDDEEVGQPFTFSDHRKGWFKRAFGIGRQHDNRVMMTFKKSLIRKAMLESNQHLSNQAIQLFKNIMSFMGDRASSKQPIPHAKKMVRNMLQSPVGLRDECYLMLAKQLTGNPSEENTLQGWRLFSIIASCFPCSKGLKHFMDQFFDAAKAHKNADIALWAACCQVRFRRIYHMGPRTWVPSELETQHLMDHTPCKVDVEFYDGTIRGFYCDSFTTVDMFEESIARILGIKFDKAFSLYETGEELTPAQRKNSRIIRNYRRVDQKRLILDVVASWENKPIESMDDDDTLLDEVKKDEYKHKGYGKYEVKHNKDFEIKAKDRQDYVFTKLLYKARLVLSPKNHKQIQDDDTAAIDLLFSQARYQIRTREYFYEKKDMSKLVAIALQEKLGDCDPSYHDVQFLGPALGDFVPWDFLRTAMRDIALQKKILTNWARLKGFSSRDARLSYFEVLEKWPHYGAHEFVITQTQYPDLANPLLLSIQRDRVYLCVPSVWGLCEEEWKYTDVITWGASDSKLIMVVGNFHQHKKLMFGTKEAREIRALLEDYVTLKLMNRKLKL